MKKIPVRQLVSNHQGAKSPENFSIRSIETLLGGDDLFQELHRHNFYLILVLEKGIGNHEIDFRQHEIVDNAIFCMRPGQVHQLAIDKTSTGFLLEFDTEFYQPATPPAKLRFRKASHKSNCKTDCNRFTKLHSILAEIFREYQEKQDGFQEAIIANLDLFFIELVRQSPEPGTVTNALAPYIQEKLEEFSDLLEKHSNRHKQVSYYTNLMNLSGYQLNEITKATVNKTASEVINDAVILEAKRHLLATANQVKDIAYNLGYEDTSYFIRFFKKQTGYSPETFRNNFR